MGDKALYPPAENYELKSGDQIYAFSKALEKWVLELIVVDVSGKNIWVNHENWIVK